jgi:hypothetical protein
MLAPDPPILKNNSSPPTLISILPSYHPPPLTNQVRQQYTPTLTLPPELNLNFTHIPTTDTDTPQSHPTIQKTICMHRYAKDAIQRDTGGNCSAANNLLLLWNYQPLDKPIPIVTYQGQDSTTSNNLEAVGTGIIKMIVGDTTVNWLTLYTLQFHRHNHLA